MRRLVRAVCLLVLVFLVGLPARASAQGGPPMLTDDPDTPGPGFWEINLSTFLEKHRRSHRLELPRLDANYGVGERIQLKFEVPWLRDVDEGRVVTGAGNAVLGVKYRFAGREGQRLAWSVYPQLAFNTTHASVAKGLVEDGREFLLPTELTIEMLHGEINNEFGRRFVEHGSGSWIYGLSTEAHVRPRLELLAELHWESRSGTQDEVIINVGARPKLTKQMILLLAVGRAVHASDEERARFMLFAGVQFNLPGLYAFKVLGSGF